ncbi:MAG: hypothetical protein KGL53_16240, partial [Elusimicrobia bacterium]|nr:hypothetical protein [Elusimicrobiota bacterium]
MDKNNPLMKLLSTTLAAAVALTPTAAWAGPLSAPAAVPAAASEASLVPGAVGASLTALPAQGAMTAT